MITRFKLFLLTAAALGLAGCSNDDSNIEVQQEQILLSSSLAVDVQVGTRAANEQNSGVFESSPVQYVDVFITDAGLSNKTTYNSPTYAKIESGSGGNLTFYNSGKTAVDPQYWPSNNGGVYLYAWYPSGKVGNNIAATNVDLSISADQSNADATRNEDLMVGLPACNPVARSTSRIPLYFTHLLSKIVVKVVEGTTMVDNSVYNNTTVHIPDVYSTYTVNKLNPATQLESTLYKPTGLTITTKTDASDPKVDLIITKAVADGTTEYAAILPPQNMNGKKLTIQLSDGGTAKYTIPDEFLAGNVYTYAVTVNRTGLQVTCSINSWGDPTNVDVQF